MRILNQRKSRAEGSAQPWFAAKFVPEFNVLRRAASAMLLAACVAASDASTRMVIWGPSGSREFGAQVIVLPNGNFVVADPLGGVEERGLVHLYRHDGTLISTLTGASTVDRIGSEGVTVLANGNYVIRSRFWDGGPGRSDAGAVTWGHAEAGVAGFVSAANSVVGQSFMDAVGDRNVVPLSNGNYVVVVPNWDNGGVQDAGAVMWANGAGGGVGVVSQANSLVGTSTQELLGNVTALTNGNYVVGNPNWSRGNLLRAGSATWASGVTGIAGNISTSNSLLGTSAEDGFGLNVTALGNGNYVLSMPFWRRGATGAVGAAMWADGETTLTGEVSIANSLVGSVANSFVGSTVTPLSNGHYVVSSQQWNSSNTFAAGAATWGDGNSGVTGEVSASNSLVGDSTFDSVGRQVTALTNGNYVVASASWDADEVRDAGAVTWGDGNIGASGVVSRINSLTGSTEDDRVGAQVTALANGHYVVASDNWDSRRNINIGAITWGNGSFGTTGAVSELNSLVGASVGDFAGRKGIVALTDGNYVVRSAEWSDGDKQSAGAITWSAGDRPTAMTISALNSLVGSSSGDLVGAGSVVALEGGSYVAGSSEWDFNAQSGFDAGAVTWMRGGGASPGYVQFQNSLVGTRIQDHVGAEITSHGNGDFVIANRVWDNGGVANAGAIVLGEARRPLIGAIFSRYGVLGQLPGEGNGMAYGFDPLRHQLIVGLPMSNKVVLFGDRLFDNAFE